MYFLPTTCSNRSTSRGDPKAAWDVCSVSVISMSSTDFSPDDYDEYDDGDEYEYDDDDGDEYEHDDDEYDGDEYEYLMSTCYSWPSEVLPPAFSMIYPMIYDNDKDRDVDGRWWWSYIW